MKAISSVDPRAVEDAAREVDGVAFAEVGRSDDRTVLRVVLWRNAPVEETAGLVELALRDSLGIDIAGGDVVIAGFADPPYVAMPGGQPDGMRVIDLGDKTWATEPSGSDSGLSAPPAPAHAIMVSMISVQRTSERCTARVEVTSPLGVVSAEASGPATDERLRLAICEAAAQAAATALARPAPGVRNARLADGDPPCAIVIVESSGDAPVQRAGAALLGHDPHLAFAMAAVQATAQL